MLRVLLNPARGAAATSALATLIAAAWLAADSSATPAPLGGGGSGLEIVYVTDPVFDRVYRCAEVVVNGHFNDSVDVVTLYDDTLGSIPLSDPICISASFDDTLYVGDASEQIVLALNDANENGDANEPGEHWLYFDGRAGGNFGALLMPHVRAVTVNAGQSVVWVATGSLQPGEQEQILRLEDKNLDLDANDFGEASVYYSVSESSHDDSAIVGLRVGGDGRLYFAENGSTGVRARGVYRLDDLDQNGLIGAGEETAFWLPSLLPNAELAGLDRDDEGNWYLLDRANSVVYRAFDANSDGAIGAGESVVLWSVSTPLACNDLAVTDEGGVYLGHSGASTRLYFGEDRDRDNAVDAGEETEAYSSDVSPLVMGAAHGLAADFHAHGELGVVFCSGATSLNCPCGNFGAVGAGCSNSTGAGASLEAEGSSGVANDDAAFHAHDLPPGVNALLFQGTLQVNGGLGAPFYDGLRCVTGLVRRFGVQQVDASGESEWGPGLASHGGWSAGQSLQFQVWYRDPQGPCSQGANLTNGVAITFDP
jgi:hypothetical protein